MQEKHLFEYAVIRAVPRVEREEFFNVGVVVYCASQNFLCIKFQLNKKKLFALYEDADVETLETRLNAFEKICSGSDDSGPIGKLPLPSRFRWLTATRSTILQMSPIHPGLCINAKETLDKLFDQLVK